MHFPGIVYGISNRDNGSMGPSSGAKTSGEKANIRNFFTAEHMSATQLVRAQLNHGNTVTFVCGEDAGKTVVDTDALITNVRGLVLTITVADCFPVWFVDTEHRVVGLAHAGWRGVASGIPIMTLARMLQLGGEFATTHVRIGPGIRACHFEVQDNGIVLPQFEAWESHIIRREGRFFIDLPGVIREQLLHAGVLPEHLEIDPACTFCDANRFFSFRRDKPARIETMVAFIGMCE